MSATSSLDLVRSIYASWERGDYGSVDWADPRIELVFVDGPSPGTWTGVTAMTDGWRGWLSAWDEWRSEPDEFRELDDARILVLDHVRMGSEERHKRVFPVERLGEKLANITAKQIGEPIELQARNSSVP